MKLTYGVKDKPKFGALILFALQELLAILAATITVPTVVNQVCGSEMPLSAALFGAGAGTIIYLLFTKFRSPVFLGSSFAFLPSMFAAFGGAASMSIGYFGLIIGAAMAGLIYVIIAIIVKFAGVKWINKLMPASVIGPTVAIIGLSLAGNAIKDAAGCNAGASVLNTGNLPSLSYDMTGKGMLCLLCALVTLFVVFICSVYGKKFVKAIPFIIGIVAGYAVAAIFTLIGSVANIEALKLVSFDAFKTMTWIPDFTFLQAIDGAKALFSGDVNVGAYLLTLFVAYVPVALVVFAEHLADHKNLSSIIESDLLEDPGLSRTLLGDGVGSMVGAFFGGCPNTTYGEAVGCVAISGNASVITSLATAILAIVASFIAPFVTALSTIPSFVMGGVCIALYGFIAVSGLKMIQKVDLEDNANLFTVSIILICGIGSLCLNFNWDSNTVKVTSTACALILGIITHLVLSRKKKDAAPAADDASDKE